MATSRRRTAKQSVGQNLNELETRIKKVERRSRGTIGSYSITSDLIAPGAITLDKLDPALLQLLQDSSNNAGSAGDSTEYLFSGDDVGDSLVTGIVDSVISQYDFSTTSASGKNSIYWQSTQPTGGTYTDGDLWFDTSNDADGIPKYTPYRYNGATEAWEEAQLGDAAFRFLDVGKLTTGVLDAAIAIRVGTYPLNAAPVGKARLEITSSFGSPAFTGIRVLKKTDSGQTETSGFSQPLEINAETGRFFLGDSNKYIEYDPTTENINISGKLVAGSGSERLVIGVDATGNGLDGIVLGPYNGWFRPASVTNGSDSIFKVGANKTNHAITVTKDGDVDVQGVVSPVGGVVKGVLTIRDIQGATNRMLFGQDVESNRDGIKLDTYNLWTISNNGDSAEFKVGSSGKNLTYSSSTGLLKLVGGDIALSGGGSFKTGDGNTRVEMNSNGIFGYTGGTKTFWIDALDGSSSFEGTTNPTGGTIKGKLKVVNAGATADTFALGRNVSGTNDGLYFNAANYWFVNNSDGSTFGLRAGGSTASGNYIQYSGGTLTISGDINVVGGNAATTTQLANKLDSSSFTGVNILSAASTTMTDETANGISIGNNTVSGVVYPRIATASHLTYSSTGSGFFLGRDTADGVYKFFVGSSSKYMKWDGSGLNINGQLVGGTTVGSGSGVVVDDSGTYKGINVNNVVRITGYGGTGSQYGTIVFSDSSASSEKGSIFDSALNKYTVTYSGGRGIGFGSSSYYPFIEAGYDSTTGTANPRIRLQAGASSYMQFNAGNFTLSAGSASSIIGISSPSGTPSKVLGKDSSNYIGWYDPGSSGGSGVTSVGLSAPSGFSVTNSPVTSSGTLALSFGTVGAADYNEVLRSGAAGGVGWGKIQGSLVDTATTITTSGFYHNTGSREAWYGGAFASASVPSASTFPANSLVVVY